MLYALGALKLYRPIYGDAIKRVALYIDQPRLDSYSKYSLTVDELLAWGENTVKPKASLAFAGLGNYVPVSIAAMPCQSPVPCPCWCPHRTGGLQGLHITQHAGGQSQQRQTTCRHCRLLRK